MNAITAGHYNVTSVLRLLWLNPGISRVEIADRLGLNRSTITHIINELLEHELVVTLAIGDSTPMGGRKKVQLGINPNYGCVAGVELHPEFIRLLLVNLHGEVIYEHTMKNEVTRRSLYSRLRQAYKHIKSKAQRMKLRLLGVGCGIPGIVDPIQGIIHQSIPMHITTPEPFCQMVSEFIEEPVFIDNDANCCCWGEIASDRNIDDSNFLYILGVWRAGDGSPAQTVAGIGMGIVLNNGVHYGKDFSAGEFRSIDWNQKNRGQFSLSDKQMSSAMHQRETFIKLSKELGSHAAMLGNVLNLDRICLGGFFDRDDAEVQEIFAKEIRRNWPYPNEPRCKVDFATYGENAVSYGGAGIILEHMFGASAISALPGQEPGIRILLSNGKNQALTSKSARRAI